MLIGPVFTRELALAPRRTGFYLARAGYVAALLVLVWTAWLVLTGTQVVRDVGDLARFGSALFQLLAPLQLVLALFFSALLSAVAVAQEKDRRTLVLLLLTNLRNSELVLGKLLASLLPVLVMLAAAWPLFLLASLLGGISLGQIIRAFSVTLGTVLLGGSLGSTLALWREKTFQAVALTVLALVLWVGGWSVVGSGVLGATWLGVPVAEWAAVMNPWDAILLAVRPRIDATATALGLLGTQTGAFLAAALGMAALLNLVAIIRVRAWNGAATPRIAQREPDAPRDTLVEAQTRELKGDTTERPGTTGPTRSRAVWNNPVIWREMRTWAYGRKILLVRVAYLVLFALAAVGVYRAVAWVPELTTADVAAPLVPIVLLSLLLVNAQAVTSLTTERDLRALDLLLVTDLTPKEIIHGKLGGVFYNTKEMILLPLGLCVYLAVAGVLNVENLLFLLTSLVTLYVFVAMLGIHAGISYTASRWAIATSLGVVFFLLFGVATCIWMMVVFSGSFHAQFGPFFTFMIGGGIGLYVALGVRNPSAAIGIASFVCPLATFYAISSFMLGAHIAATLAIVAAYGFATAAMLIPAVDEFDVATGRVKSEE